jgi:hypothetical protein
LAGAQPDDDELGPVDEFDEGNMAERELDERMEEGPKTKYGVGVRLRNVRIPESLLELFVEDAPGGGSNVGFGLEFIRSKENFDIAVGLEYESLATEEGIWVKKGEPIPQNEADKVEFDGFGWVGVDASFIWHTEVHEKVALRYGAGIGLGFILGDVLRTDFVCSTSDPATCSQKPNAEHVRDPEEDVPPVFPIVNLLVGAQFRPTDKITINVEGGIRTVPYVGVSFGYFL